MKKIIVVLVAISLFAQIIISCTGTKNNKVSEETTVNKSDSSFVDEAFDEDSLNQKTFDSILQQLNLKRSECYLRFVSSQVLPANNSLTIWVIPKITSGEEDSSGNEMFTLGGYVLLADTKSGKIESKFYNPKAWESDAWKLSAIGIDTLSYRLNDNKIMFGIYSTHQGSSTVFPAGESLCQLLVREGDSLKCIFDYVTTEYQGENDEDTSYYSEYTTDVVVTDHKTNTFYDFALLTDSRTEERKNDEIADCRYSIRDSIRLFCFTGEKYEEVKHSDTAVVYTEQIGESYRQYWYYYGKSLEQVYNIFINSEKSDIAERLFKNEMPKENLKYEVEDVDNGESKISISYECKNSKCLEISVESDFVSNYTTITEKGGYTQISVRTVD
ncbi:PA3715 family protein [Bacteroides sp.]